MSRLVSQSGKTFISILHTRTATGHRILIRKITGPTCDACRVPALAPQLWKEVDGMTYCVRCIEPCNVCRRSLCPSMPNYAGPAHKNSVRLCAQCARAPPADAVECEACGDPMRATDWNEYGECLDCRAYCHSCNSWAFNAELVGKMARCGHCTRIVCHQCTTPCPAKGHDCHPECANEPCL